MRDAVIDGNSTSKPESTEKAHQGMKFDRHFSKEGVHPFDTVEWELRDAVIGNENGEKIFEQYGVEMPKSWSQLATNVVVSKYFKGKMNSPQREHSLKQLIGRVANTITEWGVKDGYFDTPQSGEIFREELTALLLDQRLAFNSPVWFNVGVEKQPQCSACFINSVQDNMDSILNLAKTEGMLFKFGSGAGSNLSTLRSSFEEMSTGGYASGPVSFMKGYDAFAGVIKSGGKTRRAAKMVILDAEHPDIEDFITCKIKEEEKAFALIREGYDASFNGEAYSSIYFQNANHSVRVTDEFMRAYQEDGVWRTRAITDGRIVKEMKARDLMNIIADAAWKTGDPGMQFDTTINDWHTCSKTDRIYASNPCSEYMFLNDTACNLASLNLMNFRDENNEFDIKSFRKAVRLTILAQEIIVDNASYPTQLIARNSHLYRTLGLGYANLGAVLMNRGLPYDSDEGRHYSAAITALMHGEAARTSAEIASFVGTFDEYDKNRRPMLRVMRKHANAIEKIDSTLVPKYMIEEIRDLYDEVLSLGERHGYRNAQFTVLAPTGTISFMMDCDTTGIEPDIALVKYKKLVGGGMLKIVNQSVPEALSRLGYEQEEIDAIIDYINKNDMIEGAPGIKEEHLPVFDCALRPQNGKRSINYMGHIRMMAAVQPFLSGAISKTVNMPHEAKPEEIAETYVSAWRMGLKAIAIYRDGSKGLQPLNTSKDDKKIEEFEDEEDASAATLELIEKMKKKPYRRKLPDERTSITHKFTVGGHEGYITVGMYDDGQPGEIFIVMSKEGSAVSGLMDSFATAISLAFQYGVPLKVMVRKFIHTRFEPSGFTKNPQIPIAQSVMDYIFRWLAIKFIPDDEAAITPQKMEKALKEEENKEDSSFPPSTNGGSSPVNSTAANHINGGNGSKSRAKDLRSASLPEVKQAENIVMDVDTEDKVSITPVYATDAPPCPECGAITVPNGTCYKCNNCGATTGCS